MVILRKPPQILFVFLFLFVLSLQARGQSSEQMIEGRFDMLIVDTFDEHAQTLPFLQTDNGREIFLSEVPQADIGDRIRVFGQFRDTPDFGPTLALTNVEILAAAGKHQVVEGVQRIAVILVNFQNKAETPYTKAQIDSAYFHPEVSAHSYIKENSFEKSWIEGDVYDNDGAWYTMPVDAPTTISECADRDLLDQIIATVDDDIDWFDDDGNQLYDRIALTYPRTTCRFGGLGTLGAGAQDTPQGEITVARTWINGNNSARVIAHEQLHNYGVGHENSWVGCLTSYAQGPGCYSVEYGFRQSSMGSGSGHISAHFKRYIGWVDNIQFVDTDGQFTLHAIENATTDIQGLEVRRDATSNYVIEYRKGGSPLETSSSYPPHVVLHYYNDTQNTNRWTIAVPPTGDREQFGIRAGQQFYDAYNGMTVQVDDISGDEATVSISFASPVEALQPPTPTDLEFSTEQSNPRAWQNRLVWESRISPGTRDVYMCNFDHMADAPCELTPVATNAQIEEVNPDIHGDFVVWQDNRTGNTDIYLKDLAREIEIPIAVADGEQTAPRISDQLIVWEDARSGVRNIYACELDLSTPACTDEHPIAPSEAEQLHPEVSGNTIVWRDKRFDDGDIYYCTYNAGTGACDETFVERTDGVQSDPAISGDHIVWQECVSNPDCSTAESLFYFDASTQIIQPVEFSAWGLSTDFIRHPDVSDGVIIWEQGANIIVQDLRHDFSAVVDGGRTTQMQPAVSEGHMVWLDRLTYRIRPTVLHFDYQNFLDTVVLQSVNVESHVPVEGFTLFPHYPNPAGPYATIHFALETPVDVTVEVFDVLGRSVMNPVNARPMPAGRHQIVLHTDGLASGLYLYQISTATASSTGKLVVVH